MTCSRWFFISWSSATRPIRRMKSRNGSLLASTRAICSCSGVGPSALPHIVLLLLPFAHHGVGDAVGRVCDGILCCLLVVGSEPVHAPIERDHRKLIPQRLLLLARLVVGRVFLAHGLSSSLRFLQDCTMACAAVFSPASNSGPMSERFSSLAR